MMPIIRAGPFGNAFRIEADEYRITQYLIKLQGVYFNTLKTQTMTILVKKRQFSVTSRLQGIPLNLSKSIDVLGEISCEVQFEDLFEYWTRLELSLFEYCKFSALLYLRTPQFK